MTHDNNQPERVERPLILGVDPGLSGALALYNRSTGALDVYDMPIHCVTGNSGTKKRHIDLYDLGMLIRQFAEQIHLAVIEEVASMPKQGVVSTFNFGFAAGAVQAAIAANMIPMHLVRPQIWKRSLGLLRADKDASRQLASRLMPEHHAQWRLAKHDGRAEASLLARYGAVTA